MLTEKESVRSSLQNHYLDIVDEIDDAPEIANEDNEPLIG